MSRTNPRRIPATQADVRRAKREAQEIAERRKDNDRRRPTRAE